MRIDVEKHFEDVGLAVEDCVEAFGVEAQIDKAIEELAELTQALLKHRKGEVGIERVIEEIADVHVVLHQLASFHDVAVDLEPNTVLDSVIAAKVYRLKEKVWKSLSR